MFRFIALVLCCLLLVAAPALAHNTGGGPVVGVPTHCLPPVVGLPGGYHGGFGFPIGLGFGNSYGSGFGYGNAGLGFGYGNVGFTNTAYLGPPVSACGCNTNAGLGYGAGLNYDAMPVFGGEFIDQRFLVGNERFVFRNNRPFVVRLRNGLQVLIGVR